jgi:presequence protease
LADVYLDAVFHPECLKNPHIFAQEGWHYEMDGADKEMEFKGVVFNEMKGAVLLVSCVVTLVWSSWCAS